ncbi:uncharacterized protein Afti isoform X2 [Drosophila pseudoobscura]|uniref:Uncharacterized protein Afti isoform X2 n=1 Tax=Drosophila pseudoobscura pseudoobscura TaxID=46245 RepID=A0A6I8UPT0_DROPS|nr:uncharacterized protein LOC4801943 isoform X2 [Drosophila pseudoobscura]
MVNVPPLLCSTPPPIDFGEDDDDSGLQSTINLDDGDEYPDDDFRLVTSRSTGLEAGLNAKEAQSQPEPQPQSVAISAYSERPPDLELIENCEISKPSVDAIKQTVEAFNYQVKQSQSLEGYDGYQETPPPLADEFEEVEEEEEEEANINDNVPSLKLDSLSLYSTESVSASSTLSPVADADEEMPPPPTTTTTTTTTTKAPAIAPVLSHQVTLEDVSDDSDEECSPKKPKELFIREGAEDFFAIEVLATPPATATLTSTQTQSQSQSQSSFSQLEKPAADADLFNFADSFKEATAQSFVRKDVIQEQPQTNPVVNEEDEFDDFGDFADFSAVPTPTVEAMPPPVQQRKDSLQAAPPATAEDDGFDDFQEFATPPEGDADDDDDFGDFSEPLTAPIPIAVAVPPPPPPAAVHLSIDERIKPVLELMFPLSQESSAANEAKRRPLAQCQTFNFGAIEQAQALDYQWTSSEMRHSLVRSLGIDSRNILFGDKWNASMPRFAANLSFDPLKPLKPLEATPLNSQQSVGLEATTATATAAAQTGQTEARTGPSNGEKCVVASSTETTSFDQGNVNPDINSDRLESTAAPPAAVAAAAAATLSTALSANGYGHNLNGSEQLHQQQQKQQLQQQSHQQQFDLRATSTPSPPPVSAPAVAPEELKGSSTTSTPTGFAMPLKETHIYTPSKSDTAVARTTTLAPIDFDYEIAATGIIIDETVVKKEYRDVEYKPPPFGLDSPSRLPSSNGTSSFELPTTVNPMAEDDDFSDFQSMPARTQASLQPPRNGTPTFGEQMILCPAILLPQAIPLAKTTIEWGDNALSSINAEEMARIEDLFSAQSKPPTISATVAKQPPQQQQQNQQQQEDDEWSDFVSVPVPQQQQQQHPQQQQSFGNNNNINSLKKPPSGTGSGPGPKEDDWSDFVSSTPLAARPSAPQFNSGAWQSANFYNNPLSLYQHQKQTHAHSNLVPKYQHSGSASTNHNNNNNNNNNVPATPQQIHIMHDFSTAPSTTGAGSLAAGATYQQHHQRQQFQIGNAKVAPLISVIPDLSFVAPALPTNAGAFMGSLPKPSFGGKK